MRPETRQAFELEMETAVAAFHDGHLAESFRRLERAHILGQRWLLPHLRSHLWMLRVGWRRSDSREVAGQLLRLAAVFPGALGGWVPVGNTGGASVSALRPMPLPADLAPLLPAGSLVPGLLARVAVAGALAAAVLLLP